jgi:hypothetical protein
VCNMKYVFDADSAAYYDGAIEETITPGSSGRIAMAGSACGTRKSPRAVVRANLIIKTALGS